MISIEPVPRSICTAVGLQRDDPQVHVAFGRIRPAGVQEHNPDLCCVEGRKHRRHAYEVTVHGFGARVALLVEIDLRGRVDRDEEALAVHGDTVTGKEDERRVLSRQSAPEVLQDRQHLGLARIGGKQHLEAQALQLLRHVGGVVGRIAERGNILVGGVADHHRQTLVAGGRRYGRIKAAVATKASTAAMRIACRRMNDSPLPLSTRARLIDVQSTHVP